MKVILKKPVRKLGRAGTIVNVKSGYGRNYLLPQNFAVRANDHNLALFEKQQKELEAQNAQSLKEAEGLRTKLAGQKKIVFIAQAASDGKLFGSVSTKDISQKLTDILEHDINYSNILLDNPIKFTGSYNVEIALHPEVHTHIMIIVAKTDSEADDILQELQTANKAEQEQDSASDKKDIKKSDQKKQSNKKDSAPESDNADIEN